MRALVSSLLFLIGILSLVPGNAHASDFEKQCAEIYPKWFHVLDRSRCVSDLEREEADREEEVRRREEKIEAEKSRVELARLCISEDLPRMEKAVSAIVDGISEKMTFEAAQAVLEDVLGQPPTVVPPTENIKERVAVSTIPTSCESDFHFLVKALKSEKEQLRSVSAWAINPPQGYFHGPDGYLTAFSKDFDEARSRRQIATETSAQAELAKETSRLAALLDKRQDETKAEATPDTKINENRSLLDVARISAGVEQAIRSQIERCWRAPAGVSYAETLIVRIQVFLRPDGSLARLPKILDERRMEQDQLFRAAAEAARRAVQKCAPLDLPRENYDVWREFVLNFDPSKML